MNTSQIRILFVMVAAILVLAAGAFLASSQKSFAGVFSPTLKNTTSSLIAGSFTCGATSSQVLGPLSGINYFRAGNDSTATIYLAPVATSSINGFVTAHTGIRLSPVGTSTNPGSTSTFSGTDYWDIGQSNINLEGSYLACVASASGSVVSYMKSN